MCLPGGFLEKYATIKHPGGLFISGGSSDDDIHGHNPDVLYLSRIYNVYNSSAGHLTPWGSGSQPFQADTLGLY